ncbi:HTTM domain-containing protein [Algoriphagus aestuarii]|nr:HTTM domain-containing protein [Algoriphagus aestuarii]
MMFGLLMVLSIARFWAKGWIEELYLNPSYHFTFYGFEWVRPFGSFTYLIFAGAILFGLMITLGLWYRLASVGFFLTFTYIELMDKSTYLNHYYFISLISFLMIFLPANCLYSLDAKNNPNLQVARIPRWTIDCLKLMVLILYFYAGLAKINSDWLLKALPMRIWLPANNHLPWIGSLLNLSWVAFLFSWIGCLYDLSIGFLLWKKDTRGIAYLLVVLFHLMTAVLFPIGMFPYIMIGTGLIFFSGSFHEKIVQKIKTFFGGKARRFDRVFQYPPFAYKMTLTVFTLFFALQLTLPFRYMLHPGELFWTEQGYRFSWRVMLMEKSGEATFLVKDRQGKLLEVNNKDFLTPLQEKMMATQPDMILEYAHILRDHYKDLGWENPEVYADTYVSLNGRRGKALVDPQVNLALEKESFKNKYWIENWDDEIKGF